MNILEKYNYWLNHKDIDDELRKELEGMTEDEIEDAFFTDVKFQTAGMRGLLGAGSNRLNIHTVRKANFGFVKYLKEISDKPKVAISYDNRHFSYTFAMDSAKLLASHGIEVYVAKQLRPTPELSFMVRHYQCDGGIMITASHNPKEYNGYKLYDANGCQLIPSLADKVIKYIEDIDDMLSIKYEDYDPSLIHEVLEEVDEAYINEVLSIRLRKDVNKNFKIAFSSEHGASYYPVSEVLTRAGYDLVCVKEQCVADPDFSNTKSPNPEELVAYEGVLALAKKEKAELLLVCDPDGDRMGVGVRKKDGEYHIFNGNQTGALLLEYILSTRKEKGLLPSNPVMFNTIVTSDIGEKVANHYGVECEKTLTGFKYIGDKVATYEQTHEKEYVFGYEESYGSLICPFVRDKDATQACLMLAEACAYYLAKGKTLLDVMDDIYKREGAYYDSQLSISLPGADGAVRLAKIMEDFRKSPLCEVCDIKVVKYEDFKLKEVYSDGKVEALEGYDVTDVLKYYLEDGSFVAIRPSGTEPKCKVYFSVKDVDYEKASHKNDQFRKVLQNLLQ